jgi:hypothetical protein
VARAGQGHTGADPTGGAGPTRGGGRARQALLVALQALVIAAVVWFAARTLQGQWAEFRGRALTVRPRWSGVFGSAALVLLTYALLIESWRALIHAWGAQLAYGDAVRIWTVSNLGRYLPGKVWSIGAMGLLAQRAGVSPVAAAGSALLGTLVNLVAGFIVLFFAGPAVISTLAPRAAPYAALLPVVGGIALLGLPALLPLAARLAARVTRRPYVPHRLRMTTLARVAAANVASWVLYGVAFRWLAGALLPGLAGKWGEYVAVFAGSYLAGYLALVVPGGIGVRELSMTAALVRLGAASAPDAALLAVASRLWLTVLELVPGLVFIARGALRPASRSTPDVPA